jgi:hypothetical protein
LIFYQSKNLNTYIKYKMDGMSSSSDFDSASYSQQYGEEVKKMGGKRKSRVTRRRRERGGQQFRSRAGGKKWGGKKWGGKRYTKKRGGRNNRTKK